MIVKIDNSNIDICISLVHKLWPDLNLNELSKEILDSTFGEYFLYEKSDGKYIGFIQLSIRKDYVEGCKTSPTAYIEGIYVEPEYRRQAIAMKLIEFAKEWGKKNGCKELASDCELDNTLSIKFHNNAGFKEVNRLVCFIKSLGEH